VDVLDSTPDGKPADIGHVVDVVDNTLEKLRN